MFRKEAVKKTVVIALSLCMAMSSIKYRRELVGLLSGMHPAHISACEYL